MSGTYEIINKQHMKSIIGAGGLVFVARTSRGLLDTITNDTLHQVVQYGSVVLEVLGWLLAGYSFANTDELMSPQNLAIAGAVLAILFVMAVEYGVVDWESVDPNSWWIHVLHALAWASLGGAVWYTKSGVDARVAAAVAVIFMIAGDLMLVYQDENGAVRGPGVGLYMAGWLSLAIAKGLN